MFKITKWTNHITDDGQDKIVAQKPEGLDYKFRLLDDDGIIYFYGYSNSCDDEEAFAPLDNYCGAYGVTEIQYENQKGEWETL